MAACSKKRRMNNLKIKKKRKKEIKNYCWHALVGSFEKALAIFEHGKWTYISELSGLMCAFVHLCELGALSYHRFINWESVIKILIILWNCGFSRRRILFPFFIYIPWMYVFFLILTWTCRYRYYQKIEWNNKQFNGIIYDLITHSAAHFIHVQTGVVWPLCCAIVCYHIRFKSFDRNHF